jgi:hypothetical protein
MKGIETHDGGLCIFETTVPKVWKTAKICEKTFGTLHPSTHLKDIH